MASTDRPSSRHLTYLAAAGEAITRSGLFPVVRGAEARADALPRVGDSKRPAQNIVDLAQLPSLGHAAPTIERIVTRHGRAQLRGYWLGLTGPMGPLPTHLTEFAFFEQRYSKTQPFGDFLDLLAGRMLQLFYRAWADSQPAAHADRPDDDRFSLFLARLSGATDGVADDAAFPAAARVHYAALFASSRSAAAIEDSLSALLGLPVRIEEFRPQMRDLDAADTTRLGQRYATLGQDVLLGSRVPTVDEVVRIHVSADSLARYEALLPSGSRFALAAEAASAFLPSHVEWELVPEIDTGQTRGVALDGRSRLGWTSWLGKAPDGGVRGDAHLRRSSLPRRPAKSSKLWGHA